MRFYLLLLTFSLLGCQQKTITFDVSYTLKESDMKTQGNTILITDLPLYFQSNVEKNYSKKSLIKCIYLIDVEYFNNNKIIKIEYLNGNNWHSLEQTNLHATNLGKTLVIDSKTNLNTQFSTDNISMRITFKNPTKPISNLILKFRFTGKQEKTNTQYRIIA